MRKKIESIQEIVYFEGVIEYIFKRNGFFGSEIIERL